MGSTDSLRCILKDLPELIKGEGGKRVSGEEIVRVGGRVEGGRIVRVVVRVEGGRVFTVVEHTDRHNDHWNQRTSHLMTG